MKRRRTVCSNGRAYDIVEPRAAAMIESLRAFGYRAVRRFRRGSIWVPKENGKSPTLAAVGLYLLCGDDELLTRDAAE